MSSCLPFLLCHNVLACVIKRLWLTLSNAFQEAHIGHNEDISLFTIIQILSHVVNELYKLRFARSKFAKAMLEGA